LEVALEFGRQRGGLARALGIVLVAAFLCGAAAAIVTAVLPKTYEANTSLLIGITSAGSEAGYQDLLASQLRSQTYAELATTRPILTAVIEDLDLPQTPDELADSMNVQASGINPIVRIRVRGSDPDRIAEIANAIAQQLIEWGAAATPGDIDALPELQDTLATIDGQIALAEGEVEALRAQGDAAPDGALQAALGRLASLLATRTSVLQLIANASANSVSVIEPAEAPTAAAQPGIVLNVAAAGLLGALIAAGGLFVASEVRGPSDRPSAEA
jgi:capsular polysaccharide biosynthesis protein